MIHLYHFIRSSALTWKYTVLYKKMDWLGKGSFIVIFTIYSWIILKFPHSQKQQEEYHVCALHNSIDMKIIVNHVY